MEWIDIKDTSKLNDAVELFLVDVCATRQSMNREYKGKYLCVLVIHKGNYAFETKENVHYDNYEIFELDEVLKYIPIEP